MTLNRTLGFCLAPRSLWPLNRPTLNPYIRQQTCGVSALFVIFCKYVCISFWNWAPVSFSWTLAGRLLLWVSFRTSLRLLGTSCTSSILLYVSPLSVHRGPELHGNLTFLLLLGHTELMFSPTDQNTTSAHFLFAIFIDSELYNQSLKNWTTGENVHIFINRQMLTDTPTVLPTNNKTCTTLLWLWTEHVTLIRHRSYVDLNATSNAWLASRVKSLKSCTKINVLYARWQHVVLPGMWLCLWLYHS